MYRCARTLQNKVPPPFWISCEEVAAPLGFRRQVVLYLWLLLLFLYKKKWQVQLAEVAPMALWQDKLSEESKAVRQQKNPSSVFTSFASLVICFLDCLVKTNKVLYISGCWQASAATKRENILWAMGSWTDTVNEPVEPAWSGSD